MVEPLIAGAAISAAGSLLGGALSRGGGISSTRAGYYRAEDDARYRKQIRTRVKDAKAAGLHPLFALGANVSGYTPSFIPGQSRSGSALGEGIAQAGRIAGRAVSQGPLVASQIAANEASAARDVASAMATDSARKRAETEALSTGQWSDWQPDERLVKVSPMGTNKGVPLERRPLVSTQRKSLPAVAEVILPDGQRVPILNPDTNMDELSQYLFAMSLTAAGARKVYWYVKQKTKWSLERRRRYTAALRKAYPGAFSGASDYPFTGS